MARWSFILWMLLCAVLVQIGRGQLCADDAPLAGAAPSMAAAGEAEAPEEAPEGSTLVDEVFEAGLSSTDSLSMRARDLGTGHRRGGGLSPGRPASDTPFKPPRA